MRCPKCGYISFDHMDSCLKCKKDISSSVAVAGTTYHAASPSFLRVPDKDTPEPDIDTVEENEVSFDEGDAFDEEDYDFSDPELDILVDEDDATDEGEQAFTLSDSNSDDFLLEDDDESDEEGQIEFELDDEEIDEEGNFEFELEDDDDIDLSLEELTESPTLNVPEELEDISDLAPPEEESPAALGTAALDLSLDDEMSLDADLDLDGLDLDLGLSSTKNVLDEDMSLSLDDIDLSAGDIIDGSSDLDDLNMDLDLGGLDAAPAPTKEKSSGSLDGISLSLD